jgi:hypothetical protein
MQKELDRWAVYRGVLQQGVNDWKNNDFITRSARDAKASLADESRVREQESRNLLRYGTPAPSAVVKEQRDNDRGLSRALTFTDMMNRAQVQQYDADKQFANQLIGVGHGVGSTADELQNSITAARRQKDDAYKVAKDQAKTADKQVNDALMGSVVSTGITLAAAFL